MSPDSITSISKNVTFGIQRPWALLVVKESVKDPAWPHPSET